MKKFQILIIPVILLLWILSLLFVNKNLSLILLAIGMVILFLIEGYIIIYYERKKYLYEIERILNHHYTNQISNDTTILLLNQLNNYVHTLDKENQKNKEEAKKLIEDITHQIKTPLAALQINIDLIKQEEVKELCLSNTNRIEEMITTLINMAKLEAHTMPFTFVNNSLQECFEDILDELDYLIKEKELTIQNNIDDLYFSFDYLWLKEAFTNIIKNGIEYSPIKGTLYLEANQSENRIWIEIADEGPGFKNEEKEHIFDRFYSNKNNSRKQKGMGIGLNIAYEVVLAHFGKIYVENNQHTTFIIQLPIIQGKEKV